MAPPFGFTCARIVGQAKVAQHGERLGGEGLVELDHVHLVEREAGALQHLARGRHRADAHDARLDAGGGHGDDAGLRRQALRRRRRLGGDDQRRGAVVDARGVAGGDGEVGAVDALELGQRLDGGARARMLVAVDDDRVALLLRDRHRHDLVARSGPSSCAAAQRAWLRAAKASWSARLTLKSAATLSAVSRHRVDAEVLLHLRVDEAPADRGVVDGVRAREGALGLRHHEGRAGHALDAAGDHQVAVAGADRARRQADRVQPGAAEPVDRGARHVDRQARRAAPPCGRRCGCPRRPGWRSRRSRRRPSTSPPAGCAASARSAGSRPDRRRARAASAPP